MSTENIYDDIVIGVHESGIELQEGLYTSTSRNYCPKCNKNTHCYVKVDRETNEAKIHKTCNNESCKCKCLTHYACKSCGMLHPYGVNSCTKNESESVKNSKSDEEINKINAEWKEFQAQKQSNMPNLKK